MTLVSGLPWTGQDDIDDVFWKGQPHPMFAGGVSPGRRCCRVLASECSLASPLTSSADLVLPCVSYSAGACRRSDDHEVAVRQVDGSEGPSPRGTRVSYSTRLPKYDVSGSAMTGRGSPIPQDSGPGGRPGKRRRWSTPGTVDRQVRWNTLARRMGQSRCSQREAQGEGAAAKLRHPRMLPDLKMNPSNALRRQGPPL
jgi:hypothetical protein